MKEDTVFDREADHKKAAEMAAECAVLLENNGLLPLSKEQKILFVGEYAVDPRFQGGGSSHINTSHVSSAYDIAMKKGRNAKTS